MSDKPSTHADDGDTGSVPHEGPIKTPKQLILAVVFSFVIPIVAIVLLVSYVTNADKPAAGSEAFTEEAIARRLQPVGMVVLGDASGGGGALKSGADVYQAACLACHAAGVAGAPKFGDEEGWAPRIRTGYETLLVATLRGKGAMPAQGGGKFTDLEIGRAVVHMANAAGADFEEPKPTEAAVAQAETPADTPAVAARTPPATPTPVVPTPAPVAAAPAQVPATQTVSDVGQKLYAQACQVCHVAGIAGAPKFGDKANWGERASLSVEALTATVIKGKGAMPPRGGASSASDEDIKAAVQYMLDAL